MGMMMQVFNIAQFVRGILILAIGLTALAFTAFSVIVAVAWTIGKLLDRGMSRSKPGGTIDGPEQATGDN